MYTLKQLPEDFIVKEISAVESKETGQYLYFKLSKRDWNTLDAVKEIANVLNIREKDIGFAGSKDKNAVTEQIISFFNSSKVSRQKITQIKIKDLNLEFVGQGDAPISLGDLQGNKFTIVVRNLDSDLNSDLNSDLGHLLPILSKKSSLFVPNYFDEQRFSQNNVKIGKYLLLKEFKEAVKLTDNPKCQEHLQLNKNDAVGALKLIPIRLLRMYINSFQSYLWNETLRIYLTENAKISKTVEYSLSSFVFIKNSKKFQEEKIPLLGFNENLIPEKFRPIIDPLMKKEKASSTDFIIKQIPELSLEGEFRAAMVKVSDLLIGSFEDDELNSGKKKVRLEFSLPKGSYATIVVKALF